ncbi:MAG TPA: hypothetical protein VIH46_03455 [Candidatus Acidoferrales bacterium]
MKALILALVLAAVVSLDTPRARAEASPDAAGCERACLKGMLDSYFAAMLKHDPSGLPLSASLEATENGHRVELGQGIWKTAEAVNFRLDAIDPEGGQAGAESVIRDGSGLALLLVRLKVADHRILEVETMLPRKGGPLFGPDKLTAPPPMYLESVPAAERATREQLAATADRYFTALQTEGTSEYRPAPLAADANRFENGIQTTNVPFDLFHKPAATTQQQMDEAWFKGWVVTERRYPVLDEQHGIVVAIVLMQISPTQAVLLSEMFKVSGGKIRQVQAVLVDVPYDGPTGWN